MKTNWPTKKLGEVCQIRTGKKDVDEGNSQGKYPFFSCSREQNFSDSYSFDTEAILIAGNGDVGNTQIYKGKFEAYQRTYVLDKFEGDIKYIYYYLISNLKKILVRSKSGSTMPYIRKGDLENFELLIPENKTTQQKIVHILDSVQEAVGVQEKIIEKTRELKKSLMKKFFTEGARGEKLKENEIGKMPKSWEVVKLGDPEFFEIKLGGTPKTAMSDYWNGEIPWITPNDLNSLTSSCIANTERSITESGLKTGSTLLPESSIILSTRAPIGYVAVLEKSMAFNQGCKGIVIKNDKKVSNLFLYYFLNTQKRKLNELGSGSTFSELATNDLKNFLIPLPPLPEQREIAEILQTIDQKIEIEQKKKGLYEELFRTMLNNIMNQEISVGKIRI